jgi:hypothetical protein
MSLSHLITNEATLFLDSRGNYMPQIWLALGHINSLKNAASQEFLPIDHTQETAKKEFSTIPCCLSVLLLLFLFSLLVCLHQISFSCFKNFNRRRVFCLQYIVAHI